MKALSIGIHPDDADFGTAGFLIRLAGAGWETFVIDLTEGELSTNGTVEDRREESKRAASVMGLAGRMNCRLPDCGVSRCDPDQLECVVRHLRRLRPDLLLVPYWEDDHPDHVEGSHLVMRARFTSTLVNFLPGGEPYRVPCVLFYPCRRTFDPTFVVDITEVYEEKERTALCFESQVGRKRESRPTQLNAPDFLGRLRARARTFGSMIGAGLGEGYLATEPQPLGVTGWMMAEREQP